ncbi:MAG: hypothetical protein MUC42_16835, partial [Bryobacter sp.]|nr:hypothetical protein [Bryobacter sp.]
MRPFLLAVLLSSALAAQTPAPQIPEAEAYRKAGTEKDPKARIASLEKFIQDYPKSPGLDSARTEIV